MIPADLFIKSSGATYDYCGTIHCSSSSIDFQLVLYVFNKQTPRGDVAWVTLSHIMNAVTGCCTT